MMLEQHNLARLGFRACSSRHWLEAREVGVSV